MHKVFGVLAGILTFAGFFPMIVQMVRGPVSPSRATWLIWAIEAVLIYKTFAATVPNSSALWIPLGFTVGSITIFVLAIPFGEGGWSTLDKCCLAGAVATIVMWQSSGPFVGLLTGVGTDLIGAVSTINKAWHEPASESRSQWSLWWFGAVMNLCAIRFWSVAESAYPIYGILLTTTMQFILHRRCK